MISLLLPPPPYTHTCVDYKSFEASINIDERIGNYAVGKRQINITQNAKEEER